MPLNLNRLLRTSNLNPSHVQMALSYRFTVTVERRNEHLFNFQLRCTDDDDERTRLIVIYGYSVRENRWFFEPIKAN